MNRTSLRLDRKGSEMPVQMIGVVILVVLVVVAVAVFFFSGLTQQGGVIASTSTETTGGLGSKLNLNLACLAPVTCCSDTTTPVKGTVCCCSDAKACPGAKCPAN